MLLCLLPRIHKNQVNCFFAQTVQFMLLTFSKFAEPFEEQKVLLSLAQVLFYTMHLCWLVTFSSLQFLSIALYLFRSIDFSNWLIPVLVFCAPRNQSQSFYANLQSTLSKKQSLFPDVQIEPKKILVRSILEQR